MAELDAVIVDVGKAQVEIAKIMGRISEHSGDADLDALFTDLQQRLSQVLALMGQSENTLALLLGASIGEGPFTYPQIKVSVHRRANGYERWCFVQ